MAATLFKGALVALATSNIFTSFAAAQLTTTASNSTTSNNSSLINDVGALFITPTNDLAFAVRIPSDKSTQDIYFSMVMATHVLWGGIGLGSSTMTNCPLILIMYGSSNGQDVTLSPRIASYGHTEPWYNPDIRVEALPGTGQVNGTAWVYNGVCRNCRSWATPNGGRNGIDVVSKSQDMIYATGESGDIFSDDPNYPLRIHMNFGNFYMDMTRAYSSNDAQDYSSVIVPQVNESSNTPVLIGTVQGDVAAEQYRDWKGVAHAVIMVMCFVGLLPFGTFVFKLGGWVKAHAAIQGFATILIVAGVGVGMGMSNMYNRSRNYNSPHQVIGIFIFIFILAQFTMGVLNHREFRKTQQKTKLAPIHVWLGRLTILLGVVNAFLGFVLAQANFYMFVLAGLVLFFFPIYGAVLLIKKCFFNRKGDGPDGSKTGYDMEPWRNAQPQQQQQQEVQYQQVLHYPKEPQYPEVAPPPVYQPPGVGVQQSTREYV